MLFRSVGLTFSVLTYYCLVGHVEAMWTDFEMRSISSMNGSTGMPLDLVLQATRVKKGVYGISGTVKVTDAFNAYTAQVLVYHSLARNNVYKLVPAKIPEGPLCEKIEKEYRQYLMDDIHKTSDLPFSEDKSANLCSMFVVEKTFEVNKFEFNKSVLPSFLQAGMYKAHILFYKDGALMAGIEAIIDLS